MNRFEQQTEFMFRAFALVIEELAPPRKRGRILKTFDAMVQEHRKALELAEEEAKAVRNKKRGKAVSESWSDERRKQHGEAVRQRAIERRRQQYYHVNVVQGIDDGASGLTSFGCDTLEHVAELFGKRATTFSCGISKGWGELFLMHDSLAYYISRRRREEAPANLPIFTQLPRGVKPFDVCAYLTGIRDNRYIQPAERKAREAKIEACLEKQVKSTPSGHLEASETHAARSR